MQQTGLKISLLFLAFFANPSLASLNTLTSGEDLVLGENFKLNSAEYEKLISIKREQFKKLLAFPLFASKAENNSASAHRKAIRASVDPELISVNNDQFEKAWDNFYSANFKSKLEYERILGLNYLNETFLKAKLRDNLALEKYFDIILLPKIFDELLSEKLLVEEAKKRDYKTKSIEFRLALESLEDDLGGKKFLYKFRNKHKLSEKDIEAYIERDILISKLLKEEGVFKDELVENLKAKRSLRYNQELISSFALPRKTKLSNLEPKDEDLILEKLRKIKERVHAGTQVQVSEK